MTKEKKRSHQEVSSTASSSRSPKKVKEAQFSSPASKGKSPKRDQRNGHDGSKGSPAKGVVNGSPAVEKSPKKKFSGHTVSGRNGMNGVLEDVESVLETSTEPTTRDTIAESKSTPKKQKKSHNSESPSKKLNGSENSSEDLADFFSEHDRLLPGPKRTAMAGSYSTSEPYKHIVIPNLINSTLLSSVRSEILTHLHFTPKQTDIYSVSQTGDLANLSGLPSSELSSLPSLLKLRNALYSQPFRDFLCAVTGVKGLSGIKTDMSINLYEKGSHLLTHDDVIGTRCVSFILYLVNAPDVEGGWKDAWGGGLRLYKTVEGVPENEPCLTIPPQWNQMTVQPGKSFHDVEEVYTAEHPRLAISGWFHIPQEGEPGYYPHDTSFESKALSSLEQLTSIKEDKMWSFTPLPSVENYDFTEDDLSFLSKWINEVYLTPDVVEQMHEAMTEESLLELPDFLAPEIAKSLHAHLSKQDSSPSEDEGWRVAGPPHKQRFRYSHTFQPHNVMDVFSHPAFRKWIYHATGLEISSQRHLARNFRKGSDYTLATEHTSTSPQLEATLNLTPSALRPKPPKAVGISAKAVLSTKETGWNTGEFGGYEVYLAPSAEEDADPAVYKAAPEEGDDGVLVSSDASWNRFTLVLRDRGVLKFVKYVSRAAWGGRWDVTSEWTVKEDASADDDGYKEEPEKDGEDEENVLEEEEEWMGIPS